MLLTSVSLASLAPLPQSNQHTTKKQKQNNYQTHKKKQRKENLTYCQQKISIEPDEEMTYVLELSNKGYKINIIHMSKIWWKR